MIDKTDFKAEVSRRFIRYVQVNTASDSSRAGQQRPTTSSQWNLLNLLVEELSELGFDQYELLPEGYLICRIPASKSAFKDLPCIGLMAHVDTSDDESGEGVRPVLHSQYDGSSIKIAKGIVLDPENEPDLLLYRGETIITASGDTLLGADDKAGVAEIMTALSYISSSSVYTHGPLEIIFTTDEETGTGMDSFPVKKLKSRFCYTVDGGREGEVEAECYNASAAEITFSGRVVHPGYGRGKLVNAVSMASAFVNLLPRSESPEATDGRYGNFWAHDLNARLAEARLSVMIRDFDQSGLERRKKLLESIGKTIEDIFDGGKISIRFQSQYKNMWSSISKYPEIMERLNKAVRKAGLEPELKPIRGGTDGARLTEMGIPTPNIFTGGHNFHSRREWIAIPAMSRVVHVLLNLLHSE